MRAADFSSLARQSQVYSIVAGVLQQYNLTTNLRSKYNQFAMRLDRLNRRLSASSGLPNEATEAILRTAESGLSLPILAKIRDAILPYPHQIDFVLAAAPGCSAVNSITGHIAVCTTDTNSVIFIDPTTGSIRTASGLSAPGQRVVWCEELSKVYVTEFPSTTILARVDEASLLVQEVPFPSDGQVITPVVDYDKSVVWCPSRASRAIFVVPLTSGPVVYTVAIPEAIQAAVLDLPRNQLLGCAYGTNAVYAMNRDSEAITTHAIDATCWLIDIDPTRNTLFLAEPPPGIICCAYRIDPWTPFGMQFQAHPVKQISAVPSRDLVLVYPTGHTYIRVFHGYDFPSISSQIDVNSDCDQFSVNSRSLQVTWRSNASGRSWISSPRAADKLEELTFAPTYVCDDPKTGAAVVSHTTSGRKISLILP
jgi:hypothetical protein